MSKAWAKVLNDAAAVGTRKGNDVADMLARAQASQQSGQLADAVSIYKRILKKHPTHVETLHMLGLAECLSGHVDDAVRYMKRATLAAPQSALSHCNLGAVLVAAQRLDEAIVSCDRAIALQPDYADAYFNKANALLALQRFVDAVACFDKVVAVKPQHVEAWSHRGTALYQLESYHEAAASFNRAIALRPDDFGAVNNLGCALKKLHQLQDALAAFERTIILSPTYADAWVNRGEVLLIMQRYDDAFASYEKALSINRQSAEAWLGAANVFVARGKAAEALAATQQALAIKPNSVSGLTHLGQCLAGLGETESAINAYNRALAIDPNDEPALSNKIFALDFSDNANYVLQQQARSEWWDRVGSRMYQRYAAPHDNDRDPNRKLVLGYVSADFRTRSPAYAFRPVLLNHDKTQFEVICYSAAFREDDVTESFRRVADRWWNITQWSDDELAARIRADKVDILIDLSGHTAGHRLYTFARKPAPIQVHGWGFGTGTGLRTMDYMFSDPVLIPPDVRHLFAEQIYDLASALIMEPPPAELRSLDPPVLSKGYVTYGVFNRLSKISDAAIDVWARILLANVSSRLLMKHYLFEDPGVQSMMREKFGTRGVAPEQLLFMGATLRNEQLVALQQVDITLDTFPQGGGISTWESLHMGVPVVTKMGDGISSRVAGAIQTAIGMPEWVGANDDEYVEIALKATPERLRELRHNLPAMIDKRCGPLSYTREVEQAYRTMWRKYCASGT